MGMTSDYTWQGRAQLYIRKGQGKQGSLIFTESLVCFLPHAFVLILNWDTGFSFFKSAGRIIIWLSVVPECWLEAGGASQSAVAFALSDRWARIQACRFLSAQRGSSSLFHVRIILVCWYARRRPAPCLTAPGHVPTSACAGLSGETEEGWESKRRSTPSYHFTFIFKRS